MMKMEILEHKKNPLMKREEVVFSVDHDGKATPSRKDLLKEIAKRLKAKEDLLIIDRIFTSAGDSKSSMKVLVYKKPGDIPKGKLEKMKARMERKKEPKPEKEEAKPEEKKEVAEEAKEEVKEEKAEEEKPEEKAEEAGRGEKETEKKTEEEKKGENKEEKKE